MSIPDYDRPHEGENTAEDAQQEQQAPQERAEDVQPEQDDQQERGELLSRLQLIEDQPLQDRAAAFGQLHEELRTTLEAGDGIRSER